MTFDFATLGQSKDKNFRVIQADEKCMRIRVKNAERIFHIEQQEGMFYVYVSSPLIEGDVRGNYLMKTGNLRAMLLAIGFVKN